MKKTTHRESKDIVALLVSHIATQKLAPGDALPPVRALAQLWGVSPNTVRDGLLRAETLGLLDVKPRSGVFVCEPGYGRLLDLLSGTLTLVLHRRDPTFVHLWETRALLEVESAAVAARRRLPEDLQAMRAAVELMQHRRARRAEYVAADESFHLCVARTAGNPVTTMLLEALLTFLRPDRVRLTLVEGSSERIAAEHRAIYEAIAAGSEAAARTAMQAHCAGRIQELMGA
jgi:GntR family transcriptional repressor for pyruvate dehydrogenase complex